MIKEKLLPEPCPTRCSECVYMVELSGKAYCVGTIYGYCMEQELHSKYKINNKDN